MVVVEVPAPPPPPPSRVMSIGIFKTPSKERTVVNAMLKIVLRTIPENAAQRAVKDTNDKVFVIPLENVPKSVPLNLDLGAAPLELLVRSKQWGKMLRQTRKLRKQTGREPVVIVNALIGWRPEGLVAVAQGLQILEGKAPKPKRTAPQGTTNSPPSTSTTTTSAATSTDQKTAQQDPHASTPPAKKKRRKKKKPRPQSTDT